MKYQTQTLEFCRFVFRPFTDDEGVLFKCSELEYINLQDYSPNVFDFLIRRHCSDISYTYKCKDSSPIKLLAYFDKYGNVVIRYSRKKCC